MANQADFAPTLGALKDLRPFVFWAQTTLPTVFDDSLSYYEVLTKLCKMVNTLLENEDTNAENIEALATAYQELQDFTNNYFENLDVTQEINDKLDGLVADGTIPNLVLNRADTILNTYLYGEDGESGVNKDIEDLIADANADIALALSNFATNSNQAISQFELNGRGAIDKFNSDADGALDGVPDLVEDWMDDHFTNPSSVVIDDTLTVSGAAADAYATGKLMDDAENMVLATAYWQNYMIDALSQYYILADNNGGSNPSVGQGAQYKVMHIANVTPGETYLVSGVASSFSGTRYIPAYALGSVTYDTGGNPYYEFYDVYPRGWDNSSDPGAVYQYVRNQSVRIPTGTSPAITHLFIMSDSRIPVTARCSRLNVRTDDTLTSESLPAQGKATGDALDTKIPWPVSNGNKDRGTAGQVLSSGGDGTTNWTTPEDYSDDIATLQSDVAEVKTCLDEFSGSEELTNWVEGKACITNITTEVDTENLASNSSYACQIVECNAGDKFIISASSSNTAFRAYAWLNEEKYKIWQCPNNSNFVDLEVEAIDGAKWLVVNARNSGERKLVRGVDRITLLENNIIGFPILSLFTDIGVIGDSWASGSVSESGDAYPDSWPQIAGRFYGVNAVNFSHVGLTTRTWLTSTYGLQKLQEETAKKLYICALGINDSARSSLNPIGTIDDIANEGDTFYGNYGKIINAIIAKAPNAKICISTIPKYNSTANIDGYNTAIENIAIYFGIQLLKVEDDKFFKSSYFTSSLANNHPPKPVYTGIAEAYNRMISEGCIKNKAYWNTYTG